MPISTTLIKSIQDIMRQDAGVDGDAQRLSHWIGCGALPSATVAQLIRQQRIAAAAAAPAAE